jgi:lipopolysaccharide heptosyltransferase I
MPDTNLRFLVIRLSSVGDIVHALPAVAALGRTHPQARIHWAVEERYAALVEGNPYVREVIKLDTLGWRERLTSGDTIREILASYRKLQESSYDAVIDMQGLLKTGLLAWVTRSRERIGFAGKWLREPAAGVFYTRRVSPSGRKHIIEINLSLVESLGARSEPWEFPLPGTAEDQAEVRGQLEKLGVAEYIIVNPGAGWIGKRWSPENYARAIRRLSQELPLNILLTGSRQEEEMIRGILAMASTPRTQWFPSTLAHFIALARGAKLLIAGDTGPLHLAAAVGTPLVAVFDSSDPLNTPERNGPFSPADIVLCGRSQSHRAKHSKNSSYLEGVSIESVVEAALLRLKRANG